MPPDSLISIALDGRKEVPLRLDLVGADLFVHALACWIRRSCNAERTVARSEMREVQVTQENRWSALAGLSSEMGRMPSLRESWPSSTSNCLQLTWLSVSRLPVGDMGGTAMKATEAGSVGTQGQLSNSEHLSVLVEGISGP